MNPENCERIVSTAIYQILASRDPACAAEFSKLYREPADQSIPSQIASANRFWRFHLGTAAVSTTAVRENLIDDCSWEDWLRHFTQDVAPVVVELKLPQPAPLI